MMWNFDEEFKVLTLKDRINIVLLLLLLVLQIGCKESDEGEDDNTPVVVNLAFSVSSVAGNSTRLAESVVQTNVANYRGIQDLYVIPFGVQGKIQATDRPKVFVVNQMTLKSQHGSSFYYYTPSCVFMPGTSSCLCYARAIPSGEGGKAYNGSLEVENLPFEVSSELTFRPESIYSLSQENGQIEAPESAKKIAEDLTYIANATGEVGTTSVRWENSENSTLRALYLNFIGRAKDQLTPSLLAGSVTSTKMYVRELKKAIEEVMVTASLDIALKEEILEWINKYLDVREVGYPNNIGLPDGVAVLQWSEDRKRFEPQMTKTSMADINAIDALAYPAELYYWANSRICSSNKDTREDAYTPDRTWNSVLAAYEYQDAVVSGNTKAVAVKEPMRYAVARLQVTLKQTPTAVLLDAYGKGVTVNYNSFPLTGMMVGGQHPVGFDFKPLPSTDEYIMYDSHVRTANEENIYLSGSREESDPVNTFVLQTKDGEDVTIVLEFQNNSDKDFQGVDGVIYRGTKFYLIGTIEMKEPDTDDDYKKRVFTQDYTTSVSMTVASLAKAYNVLPNIRSPRLEVGVQLTPKWVQAETTNVILE